MQVFRHIPNQPCEPLTLAIGNFDGMHLGHQELLQANIKAASSLGKIPAVLTFEPHPREFFTPHNAPARLTTLREKLELLDAAGIKKVFICAFNKRFAAISAEAFLNILLEQLNANTKEKLIEVITPKDAKGCQVSMLMLKKGKEVFEALKNNAVIADWREPNVIRIAPVPLYNSFEDIWKFGEIVNSILNKD